MNRDGEQEVKMEMSINRSSISPNIRETQGPIIPAVGIAKALKFLHSHASSMVLVGEVSPEIVWVDAKGVPRLKVTPPMMPCLDAKSFVSSPYVAQGT